jgi:hypothetical protein
MREVGHSDPKVSLGIYAKVMLRRDGERERLRALVRGMAPCLNSSLARAYAADFHYPSS